MTADVFVFRAVRFIFAFHIEAVVTIYNQIYVYKICVEYIFFKFYLFLKKKNIIEKVFFINLMFDKHCSKKMHYAALIINAWMEEER